jgi:hypothetical protein
MLRIEWAIFLSDTVAYVPTHNALGQGNPYPSYPCATFFMHDDFVGKKNKNETVLQGQLSRLPDIPNLLLRRQVEKKKYPDLVLEANHVHFVVFGRGEFGGIESNSPVTSSLPLFHHLSSIFVLLFSFYMRD